MTLRVLVVDDEAPARAELRYLLGRHDEVAVSEAPSAAAALELVEHEAFDALFLDVEMPGRSGLEAVPALRGGGRAPAIVFVTAHAEYAVEAFAVEAFDYLLKPVDPDRLARVVERLRERTAESPSPVARIPVVARGDRLVGIVSMADIAREADVDEELQDTFEDISSERSFWSRLR